MNQKKLFKDKKMRKALFAILAVLTLLTGCSKSENTNTVSTDGSTSMKKVIGILGEVFTENKKGVNFTYNPTGSGTGISSVLENRCDIGLSSRNLKQSEIEKGLTETILAYDGIAIIVNKENPISNLQLETLEKIFTGVITNWKEIGGSDSEIVLIGREAGSGTRDGFESITKTSGKCKYRQELTSTGDVIATVSGNPLAIGYASVASVKDSVKLLSINNVLPNNQTIKSGSYEIQRPFVMVTKKDVPLSKWAQEFFDFALSPDANKWIEKAGVVPAN
jgi:phosphate transport system substrate-binding protein